MLRVPMDLLACQNLEPSPPSIDFIMGAIYGSFGVDRDVLTFAVAIRHVLRLLNSHGGQSSNTCHLAAGLGVRV